MDKATRNQWLPRWKGKHNPVCPLRKALYGHPDSGTYWEKHCDACLRAEGFLPVGEAWPSCYYHRRLRLMLIVYVDDFKLVGPSSNLSLGWKLVRKGLVIEDPRQLAFSWVAP